ncbi:MAG: PilW family protein [Vicinamibacterales bacterium]
MSQRGFTLIELLIACLLVTAVAGAVAALAVPARNAFDRTLGAADLSGGSRAALERLMVEVREAGSGAAVAFDRVGLADVTPVVMPGLSLDNLAVAAPAGAFSVTRIGLAAPQGVLLQSVNAGGTTLQLDTSGRCRQVGVACGLEPGMTAVVYDASRAVTFTVGTISAGGFVHAASGLPAGFAHGAIVAERTTSSYGLRTSADGSQRLVRVSPGGAEQPVLQNVVDFAVRVEGRSDAPQPGPVDDGRPSYGPAAPRLDQDDSRDAWGPGENCTTARDGQGVAIPRLAALSPAPDPVPISTSLITDGPWCPDGSDPLRFDADLLRVRSVELRLRVEAASAVLRGPAGRLFRRPGTERNAARWVPDVEMRVTVRMRNVGR